MKDLRKLLHFIRPYHGLVRLNILFNILMAVFTVVSIPAIIPFFQILFGTEPKVMAKPEFSLTTSWALDTVRYQFSQLLENYSAQKALIYVCLVVVLLFFLKNLFRYLSLAVMAPVRNGIVADLRNELLQKMMSLPIGYYTEERRGDLLTRMSGDISEIEFSILSMLEAFFREPIVVIGSLIFMIYISPALTLFVFVLLFFTVFIIGGISRTLKSKSKLAQTRLGNLLSQVEEALNGLRIVKAFNAESYLLRRFEKENSQYRRLLNRILWRRDLSSPLSEFLGIVVVATLLWYGSSQVFNGSIVAEDFFGFLFAFYSVINPVKAFSNAYYNVQKGLAAVDRVYEILDSKNEIVDSPSARTISTFRDSIEFKKVSFKYIPDGEWILSEVDFKLSKGKTLAIVGSSGSGKSTLVDLIPRFYDTDHGSILLDGVPIKEVTIDSLRNMIAFVSQEPILFHDTIYNNITFGTKDVDKEEVMAAAKQAFAHDFILEAPEGYDTVIGDKGVKLSGGQRQRLTLARALLQNRPILILDEATSALDSESEQLVKKALNTAMRNKTVILIAHRLSTVQYADEIIVLQYGKIVERGSHEELLELKGAYLKFVELQSV